MDQIRITNPSQFKAALHAILIADQASMWISLRQQDNLTLTYTETDIDGFEGLAVRMAEDMCIHAFLLVKSAQFKIGSQNWVYTNIRPSRQCGLIQLCFVGKDSGITRTAAHRAHHFRGLTMAADGISFSLISDSVFDLSSLLDKVTKDKIFCIPTYMTVVPNKGFFTVVGTPQSPFPISLSSFVTINASVRVNIDTLSTTGLLADAFKVVNEIKHEKHKVREQRRNRITQFNSTERHPPRLLPQIDNTGCNMEQGKNNGYSIIHSPRIVRDSPPVPPPRHPEIHKTKFNSTLQQPGHCSKGNANVALETIHASVHVFPKSSDETCTSINFITHGKQSSTPQSTGLKPNEIQITHLNSVLMSDTSYLDNLALPFSNNVTTIDGINPTVKLRDTQAVDHTSLGVDNAVPIPSIKSLENRPVRPRSLLIRRFTQTDNRLKENEDDFNTMIPPKHERSHSSSSITQISSSNVYQNVIPEEDQKIQDRLTPVEYEEQNKSSHSKRQERGPSRHNATDIRAILSRPSSVAESIPGEVDLLMEKVNKIHTMSPLPIRKDTVDNSKIFMSNQLSEIQLFSCYPDSDTSIAPVELLNVESQTNIKDLDIVSSSIPNTGHSSQKPFLITSYKPSLNQLSIDIAALNRSCELNPQLQTAFKSLQTAVFDMISAINHEVDPEHKSIRIFDDRITAEGQSRVLVNPKPKSSAEDNCNKNMETCIYTLRDRLVRVAMTLLVNIGTDKGLVYGDIGHMINAVSIYLPSGGLKLLRTIILGPLPLDINVLVNEGLKFIEFCNKI